MLLLLESTRIEQISVLDRLWEPCLVISSSSRLVRQSTSNTRLILLSSPTCWQVSSSTVCFQSTHYNLQNHHCLLVTCQLPLQNPMLQHWEGESSTQQLSHWMSSQRRVFAASDIVALWSLCVYFPHLLVSSNLVIEPVACYCCVIIVTFKLSLLLSDVWVGLHRTLSMGGHCEWPTVTSNDHMTSLHVTGIISLILFLLLLR